MVDRMMEKGPQLEAQIRKLCMVWSWLEEGKCSILKGDGLGIKFAKPRAISQSWLEVPFQSHHLLNFAWQSGFDSAKFEWMWSQFRGSTYPKSKLAARMPTICLLNPCFVLVDTHRRHGHRRFTIVLWALIESEFTPWRDFVFYHLRSVNP